MAPIIFPTSTAPGAKPGEGSGRLINAYAEKLDDGARAPFARRRVPGLNRIADTAVEACRGLHFFNGTLYVAQADTLFRIDAAGTVTNIGDLPGTKRVTFARNNKAPVPDILCTTEDDTFIIRPDVPPQSLDDADLPQALTVDFIDGYFIWAIRDGRFFVSGINDRTVNALDFGKAESQTGGLLRAVGFSQQLVLFGPSVIEFWQNVGNATGSPFSRAATFPIGLASTFAVAGNELGFQSLVFVGSDNGVYRLDGGYQPTKISTPDLDRLIEKVADKDLIDVTVSVTSGHRWATVSGPNFSWVYELTTGFWHERASYLDDHWRGVCSVQAFGSWAVGDRVTGDVWRLDADYAQEGESPLVVTLQSLPGADFPNRTAIPRADFDITVGHGLVAGREPIDTDPVVFISWSDDGGNSFNTPLERNIGRQAKYHTGVAINRAGTTGRYGRVWKLEISDPVYVSVNGGEQQVDARSR